ncbi:MAG: CDP-alcohol phosphatidyltransferase family protein, partial [Proteobacteria bacterium]|nr:CDP-alcohol phosphatidyltransferase family protein [Pseudomonadota bacterium]
VVLIGILGLVVVAYSFRLVFRGRAQFDRVEKQGGSVLLGKGLMEMAYWALQPVARFLIFLKITPNQLSWASLVLGGMAGTALAYGYFGFGALFSTYSAFLDTLDGMVARATGVASDAGEVLDAAVDRYVEFFFLTGVILYYREMPTFQTVALLALVGSFMISYSTAKAEALHIPPPPGIMRRPERAFYLTLGAALSPIPMPWLDTLFNVALPVPGYPLIIACFVIAVLANISAIERLWTIGRMMREKEHAAEENLIAQESLSFVQNKSEDSGDEEYSPQTPRR